MGKIKALTGSRFIAAMLVLNYHLRSQVGSDELGFAARGYLGVDFFFVLSGFVISKGYWGSARLDSASGLVRFMVARLARIWPLHALWMTVYLLRAILTGAKVDVGTWIRDLMMIQAWGFSGPLAWNHASWSISAEWFGYGLFGLMMMFAAMTRMSRLASSGGAIAVATLSAALLVWFGGGSLDLPVDGLGCVRYVFGFSLGFLANVWAHRVIDREYFVGSVGLVLVVLALAGVSDYCAPLGSALICSAVSTTKQVGKFLGARPLVLLGEWSYGVYLCHMACFWVSRNLCSLVGLDLADDVMLVLLIHWMIPIACAAMLYYTFEVPARKLILGAYNRSIHRIG